MINLQKKIKKLGAGIMAGLCAISVISNSIASSDFSADATSSINTENTAFPTADEVIAQAATLLGSPYGWGFKGYTGVYYKDSYNPLSLDYVRNQGVDCSGLIYYTLTHLGYSTNGFSWNNPVPVDTTHWLSVNGSCTISRNGVTSDIDVEKVDIPYTERPYWECTDGTTITPGSMVIADNLAGEDHSWIYMGEFDSRDEVIKYLRNIGVNEEYINSNTVGDGNGDGGTHWRIESNGSQGCVINNRTDGKKATAMNMYAFRVTQTNAEFSITKVLSTDNNVKISGISSIDGSRAIYGVYTDKGCTNKVGEIAIGTDGTGSITLPDKTYYVKEISAPTGYDISDNVVKLKANGNVNVQEDISSGRIIINKTAEDGIIADREFEVSWTENGIKHSKNIVTGADGTAEINDLHVYDFMTNDAISYTVSEVISDSRYVAPKVQNVILTNGNSDFTSTVSFNNTLKKFTAEIIKKDSENTSVQGDASLAGAVYGLFRDGERIAQYTTDENGYFKTDEFKCGNYTLQELSPSQGYLINDEIYPLGAEPENFSVEFNKLSLDVYEDVIKGNVSIIKHSDDDENIIENLENGAEFEIYLKSAGSFENAKDSEKDYLITDENGFAESKYMPYGTYTVHQTKTVNDAEFISDFDVDIIENGKTYKYILNDTPFKSYIYIEKTDAETGKVIPYENAGFQIFNAEGELINLGTDTFYTNNEGFLITPQPLEYGEYTLVEIQAPIGYVLDRTPVKFTVSADNANEENAIRIIKVSKADTVQKGRISVIKTGEVFSSVNIESDNKYSPVFEEKGLKDAVLHVIAVEDIITPDGTIRANAGDVVSELVTDENGYAETNPLYLGKYEIKEISAPYGYILDNTSKSIELTYAGQEIAVTDTVNTALKNEYQGINIHLEKIMEYDEKFDIGNKREYLSVHFGLFAAENITAADGAIIPKNSLITEVSLNEDMTAVIAEKLPFSRYYVQEISTDEHYMLNGEKYLVNFEYMGQEVTTVNIKCGKFTNKIKRGSISGKKVNEKKDPLENAVFGLFKTDEVNFTTDNAYYTVKSDKEGNFEFKEIPYGKYIIKEIEAPTGYILSNKQFSVNISENNDTIEITAENTPISVAISKTDLYGNELEGAEMELFNIDGEIVEKWTSDTTSHIITNLSAGKYTLKETAAPDGYIIATDIIFLIDEHGKVTVNGIETSSFTDNGIPIVTMIDKAKVITTPPPTGDTSNSSIGLAMIITGIVGLLYVASRCIKKNTDLKKCRKDHAELCPDFIEKGNTND